MSIGDVNEAMSRMLAASDDVERKVALGQLLERLVRAAGQPADRLGVVAAAVMLLWRASENGEEALQAGGDAAKTMLFLAKPDVPELSRLAAIGRALLGVALELQGEQLLAEESKAPSEYKPREGDVVVWLGKHIAKVLEVDKVNVTTDSGPIETISTVVILTVGGQRIPVSPEKLELYRREG